MKLAAREKINTFSPLTNFTFYFLPAKKEKQQKVWISSVSSCFSTYGLWNEIFSVEFFVLIELWRCSTLIPHYLICPTCLKLANSASIFRLSLSSLFPRNSLYRLHDPRIWYQFEWFVFFLLKIILACYK